MNRSGVAGGNRDAWSSAFDRGCTYKECRASRAKCSDGRSAVGCASYKKFVIWILFYFCTTLKRTLCLQWALFQFYLQR